MIIPLPKIITPMKSLFSLIVLVLPLTLLAQKLVITITPDTTQVSPFLLLARDFASGENDTLLNFSGKQGKTIDTSIQISRVFVLTMEDPNFLIGPSDSIAFAYDYQKKKYKLLGGSWPENYSILQDIKNLLLPYKRYNPAEDNYEEYVRALDSASFARLSLLDNSMASGKLSSDAFNYMKHYIRYVHVNSLMRFTNSRSFKARYPATFSKLSDSLSITSFDKDKAEIFYEPIYQMSLLRSLTLQFRKQDSLNFPQNAIDYVLNKYKGIEKGTLLHLLLVNSPKLAADLDLNYFGNLVASLPSQDIPERYSRPVREAYKKRIVNGKMIPADIMQQAQLRTAEGTVHRLDLLLEQYKGKKILIDFWASWCGPCIAAIAEVKKIEKQYEDKNLKVLYFSLDTNEKSWKAAASKLGLGTFQYLLESDFSSSLATYFNIQGIPFYLLLDETGRAQILEPYELHNQF